MSITQKPNIPVLLTESEVASLLGTVIYGIETLEESDLSELNTKDTETNMQLMEELLNCKSKLEGAMLVFESMDEDDEEPKEKLGGEMEVQLGNKVPDWKDED